MADPFIGEVRLFSFGFPPQGWALCNGQVLQISQNQALFAILGTTYGGDGVRTFALPDLRGRVPLHTGSQFPLGSKGGEEFHALTQGEIPADTHQAVGSSNAADLPLPSGNFWASGVNGFSATANVAMAPAAIGNAGSGQSHENRSPYAVVSFGIALTGIFPSRN